MNISDDQPPSSISDTIQKLNNRQELADYGNHLVYLHTHKSSDDTESMKEKLMLQGLDEDDLFKIHEFLAIDFDGDIIKIFDEEKSKKRLNMLSELLDI